MKALFWLSVHGFAKLFNVKITSGKKDEQLFELGFKADSSFSDTLFISLCELTSHYWMVFCFFFLPL